DIANITFGKNDTPYVAYYYRNIFQPYESYVKKLVGNWWELIYHFRPNTVCWLAMDTSATPHIVYADTLGKLCVEKSGGGNWSTPWQKIGKPGFSPGKVDFVTMVINNMNVPIVAYQDEAQGNKMSVMAFDCFPEEKLDICAVILDTVANNRVAVIWDPGNIAEFADSFCIYREDSGIYTKLATLPLATYRFIDASANPDLRAYRYKVTYVNKCGIEAPAGPGSVHRTIKLDFMHRSDEFASLKWNRYEGIHDPIYTIMRSNNGGPFLPIAKFKINGNDTTYMDNYQPAGENRYRIDIELDNACVYYTTYYRKITSNTVTSWKTGITEIAGNNNIVIAPNPVYNELRIISGANIAKVEITDIMGKTLI
ncbi:MAG: hypothetical protein K8F30_03430, partial [Taibaiella sp.]|nr:hypothetical protein [Taibaiella sp.]